MTIETRYAELRPSIVIFQRPYQREPNKVRIHAMARNIREELLGTMLLSERADGSLWGVDCQHRVMALVEAGRGDNTFTFKVLRGLSVPEEARLFYDLNYGSRKPDYITGFLARVGYGDPSAVAVASVLAARGLRIANTHSFGALKAARICEHAELLHKNLGRVVDVLTAAYGDHKDAHTYDGVLVAALSDFLAEYPNVDESKLVTRMQGVTARRLAVEIKEEAGLKRAKSAAKGAAVRYFVGLYNARNKQPLEIKPVISAPEVRKVA